MDKTEKNELMQVSFLSRGTIMDSVITIERLMDTTLAQYFSSDRGKQIELIEYIFSTEKLTFSAKKDLLLTIIKNHHPHFLKEYKFFATYLEEIMTTRNLFAHCELETDEELNETQRGLHFKTYKKGKLVIRSFYKKEMLELKEQLHYLIVKIFEAEKIILNSKS